MAVSMALARLARFTVTSCVAVGQVALRRVRIAFVIIMGKVYRTFVRVFCAYIVRTNLVTNLALFGDDF